MRPGARWMLLEGWELAQRRQSPGPQRCLAAILRTPNPPRPVLALHQHQAGSPEDFWKEPFWGVLGQPSPPPRSLRVSSVKFYPDLEVFCNAQRSDLCVSPVAPGTRSREPEINHAGLLVSGGFSDGLLWGEGGATRTQDAALWQREEPLGEK